jgi:hypothetical protein
MPSAENAQLQYEAGQTAFAMSALTNSGDATTFTSSATLWSRKAGFAPVVRPNGLISGGAIAVTGTNNVVSVAALTCNLNGTVTSVNAGNATITRPASNVSKVCSITIDNSGAIAVVAGTDGASAAFSETRAAAGGPPLIPTTSIEIGQVRVTTSTAAVITAAQIFTVPGLHVERADSPLFDINYAAGTVTFAGALPLIHTGTVPKAVHASYASPIFAAITQATNFVMPETSYSLTSTPIYGGAIASSTSTLNQGSFTAFLNNGVNDPLVQLKGQTLWFKFFPDRYQSPYMLTQGKLGLTRAFDPAANIQSACTISAESAGQEVG